MKLMFQTNDGKLFEDEKEALAHELDIAIEPLTKDVNDLLNQIVIKLKDVKSINRDSVNYTKLGQLEAIKAYCEKVLKNNDEALEYQTQYYNSNCY